jgi:predicted PurR-regulated permease PerM
MSTGSPPPVTSEPVETEIVPPDTPGTSGLLTLAVGVVIVAALYVGQDVFVPIVLAILLSFVLAPLTSLFRRTRIGRTPSVILAILLALGIIGAIGTVIGLQVATLAQDLPRYQSTIVQKLDGLRGSAVGRALSYAGSLGKQVQKATEQTAQPEPAAKTAPVADPEPKPLPVEIHEPEPSGLVLAQRFLGPVIHPLTTAGLVLIITIFILLQREDLRDRMIRIFGARDLHRTTVAMDDAARRLSRYFLTQLGLNAAFGAFIAVGLWLIGVPSPVLWGIFAGLMRFVPYIGSFLAGAFPVALAAAVDPTGWSMALWVIALFAISEPIMGHAIEPTVYGHSTGMSPFAVIVAAIFWTWLWGPIGLLLATPFTVILVVLGRHVDRLEFLDVLFGDRPALTPIETFYQRVLAGDPDEAQEYAELLLKDRSLSSYYDEVALKGLQLAANDAARGVLTATQLETIRRSVRRLVFDLSEYKDITPNPGSDTGPAGKPKVETDLPMHEPADMPADEDVPEAWRQPGAIVSIAGRGALDEGAAAMLAQLLEKHGLGSRLVPHEAVSRDTLGALDLSGTTMVCISYLEISGNPAHLRYLLRRMRRKVGAKVPMLVGLWPSEDQIITDQSLRSQIGADFYVVNLRDAVEACMTAAKAASEGRSNVAEPTPVRSGPAEADRRADASILAAAVPAAAVPAAS